MEGLEIVMDIDTLKIYEVIDHDQNTSLESSNNSENHVEPYQLNLFEAMNLLNI